MGRISGDFEELEKTYYADKENGKVVEALWWNWSTRCGDVEEDVICVDLSLSNAKKGHRLPEEKLLRVDKTLLFKTREGAEKELKE